MEHAIIDITSELKAARHRKKLTQRDLSAKTGISQSHINNIENGSIDVRLSTLIELARVLELEVAVVPKRLVPALEALRTGESSTDRRPAYSLDEGDEND